MNDPQKIALILVLLVTSLGFAFVDVLENRAVNTLEREAILLGFAEHNPTNGLWQWKEPK